MLRIFGRLRGREGSWMSDLVEPFSFYLRYELLFVEEIFVNRGGGGGVVWWLSGFWTRLEVILSR